MSYPKRSQISAYEMYSKSSRHNQSYSSDNSHNNHGGKHMGHSEREPSSLGSRDSRNHREKSYDSDEEVLKGYAPKSLASSVSKDHSSEKQRTHEPSKRNESARGRHFDNDKKPAKSLMDIDFSRDKNVSRSSLSKWKDMPSHHGFSSGDESHEHLGESGDWKSGKRYNKYTDSEEEGDAWHSTSKSRRTWKNSSTLAHGSGYSSQSAALVVDMEDGSSKSGRRRLSEDGNLKPKSLLDAYIPPLTKKTVSLLDLPNVSGRSESRFQRKSPRSDFSGLERKPSSYTRPDHRSSGSSRKRPNSADHHDRPIKKSKDVKSKSESKVALVDSNKLTVCKTSGQTFLIIPSLLTTLYLHGKAKVTVLMGNINILGHKLRAGSTYDVFSPSSGSLLAMQASDGSKFKASDVREELSKFNIPENDKDLESLGNNTIAVLKVDKLESIVCDYATSFIPYTQLFTAVPSRDLEVSELKGVTLSKLGLKVSPMNEMVSPCMHLSQNYDDVLAKWTKRLSGEEDGNKLPIVLCCGAKNTGKSTFNRMLINTALKSVSAVAYLECDVGQTEFSPPATMSLHVLKQPVLEPPFCHQRHAEKMVFYGETSPNYDPSLYVQCLKFIVEAFHELSPKMPLIVNTMGFPEGVGVMLLIDTVHLVKPDLVVQIKSFSHAANLPPLTHELVALEEGWTFNKTPVKDTKLKLADTHQHELVLLPTLVSQRKDFKLKPVDLRNLTLLSALSVHLEKGMTLTSLPPYEVPYRQFGVHVCHHRLSSEEILAAVVASVVALCVADLTKAERKHDDLPFVFPDMPVCTCVGIGIVRGVDVSKGLLYLVTTLPRMYLQSVNTILKGSLSLPDQMFLKQTGSNHIPYVDALAPSTAVASVRPRSRMPRVSLGGNK